MDEYTQRKLLGTNMKAGDAPLDRRTGAQTILTDLDRDINEGHGWQLFYIKRDLVSGGVVNLQIKTGPDGLCMRKLVVWGDASVALLQAFRAPTLTDGTTAIPIFNLHHAIEREVPPGIVAYSDPSEIIDDGTCYDAGLLGGGDPLAQTSKAWREVLDVANVLAPDTDYMLRLTNLNGSARNFGLRMFFCA